MKLLLMMDLAEFGWKGLVSGWLDDGDINRDDDVYSSVLFLPSENMISCCSPATPSDMICFALAFS